MSLLDRIAQSDGNPQRSIIALRLINERLAREMAQHPLCARALLEPKGSGLLVRVRSIDAPHRPAQQLNVPQRGPS